MKVFPFCELAEKCTTSYFSWEVEKYVAIATRQASRLGYLMEAFLVASIDSFGSSHFLLEVYCKKTMDANWRQRFALSMGTLATDRGKAKDTTKIKDLFLSSLSKNFLESFVTYSYEK